MSSSPFPLLLPLAGSFRGSNYRRGRCDGPLRLRGHHRIDRGPAALVRHMHGFESAHGKQQRAGQVADLVGSAMCEADEVEQLHRA